MRPILASLSLSLLLLTSAEAGVIATCGASNGYAYYMPGRLLSNDQAGWTKDKISAGQLQLHQDVKGFDIRYVDASASGTTSLRKDGFKIIHVPQPQLGYVTLLAVHPSTSVIEHYLFQLAEPGPKHVLWGSIKGPGVPIMKSSLMRAECKKGE